MNPGEFGTSSPEEARQDLHYLEGLLRRARRRIDTHAFHYVHWGLIVAVWYPLANAFQLSGHPWWQLPLGIAALILGFTLSGLREVRLRSTPRTPNEDTKITALVRSIVFANLIAGFALSAVAPATGWIAGEHVPVLWGLVYANMSVMMGLVYLREHLGWGALIFLGSLLAMAFPRYCGFILGPCMALGTIVPGVRAERRVLREAATDREPAIGSV